jgi:hypothetical protein
MYAGYTAFESENLSNNYYGQKYATINARKTQTAYFSGLDAGGFDKVVNPVVIEPMVQFTLYLKVKYELAGAKGK